VQLKVFFSTPNTILRINRQIILILEYSFYFSWETHNIHVPETTVAINRATEGAEVLWGQAAGLGCAPVR